MAERFDQDKIIADYLAAFGAGNTMNALPILTYSRGWFSLKGSHGLSTKYRRADIIRMTNTLSYRVEEAKIAGAE